jgi:hypothetical protein
MSNPQIEKQNGCKKYNYNYLNILPNIHSLSSYSSAENTNTIVFINGENFSYNSVSLGYSVVNFGSFKQLPISFWGSQTISFQVPLNAPVGTYEIQVMNILSPNPGYSNSVAYTIT